VFLIYRGSWHLQRGHRCVDNNKEKEFQSPKPNLTVPNFTVVTFGVTHVPFGHTRVVLPVCGSAGFRFPVRWTSGFVCKFTLVIYLGGGEGRRITVTQLAFQATQDLFTLREGGGEKGR
jgi:hypothetical protein